MANCRSSKMCIRDSVGCGLSTDGRDDCRTLCSGDITSKRAAETGGGGRGGRSGRGGGIAGQAGGDGARAEVARSIALDNGAGGVGACLLYTS